MPSFYFEQLLQTGLNGIDQQGITAAVLQIAGVILILSLLWSVYEAYSNGGDVRLLGVAAVKYLVLGLVFLNYQSAFRAVNSMFNGVADGIYNLSGGLDAVQVLVNSLSQAWRSNPNWFSSLWNLVTGGVSAIVAGLITLIGYLILPFTYTLFTLFYALYGSILYVVGPFVLALMPSRGLGQLGRTYFVNMMIFQCWGLLYAILQSLMSALQITNPMQFNGSFLQAFVGSSQMIVMSVASVLLSIMVALIPFIASRIVRGDIGSTLMTVISGAMTAGAVASGLAFSGGGGLAAGRQAPSGGPPSPPSGGSAAVSQGSGVGGQGSGGVGQVQIGWRRRDWRFKTTHTSKFRWSQRNRCRFCQWGSIHWRNAFRSTGRQRFAFRCRAISQWLQRPQSCRFRGLASRTRDWQNHALGRDGCRTMKTPQSHREAPEIASFTRYYEHDGMLRAYANRAMFLAILFAVIALSSLGFAIYVRIQPPTVIRVDKDGNAVVVGGGARQDRTSQMAMVLSAQAAGADATASEGVAPTDLEGKAVVRRFLEHYLSYTPDSAPRNLAESLNMMTNNLRTFTLNKLRDDDTVGKIVEDHIISDLRIRSIERTKNGPWDYVVFGVKEVHKVKSGAEVTDRIVGQYNIRLVEERRSEFNPSGLLVAEYSEKQMVGERDNGLEQKSELDK